MADTDYATIDFFRDKDLFQDPTALLRVDPRAGTGVARSEARRGVRLRVRRGGRRLPRLRAVLELQHGGRSVLPVAGAARGRRHQRHHRGAPRRAAVQRPAPVVRSAAPHRAARAADAPDHTEAPEGERGVHGPARRPGLRRVHRPGPVRVRARLRAAVHAARRRRPARRARGRPRRVPEAAHAQGAAVDPEDGAQAARVPLRAVHRVHRGPSTCAARRRDDRSRQRHVPRRHAAAGPRRDAHRRQPLQRGWRDDRAPDVDVVPHPRRPARSAGGAARRPDADPRLHGGGVAAGAADQGRVPVVEGGGDGRATWSWRRAPACSCSTPPPTATRDSSTTRSSSSSTAPTAVSTSASVTASTRARARPSRAPRPRSPSRSSSPVTDDIRISEAHHGPADARRYEYDPTYMLRGLRELYLEFTLTDGERGAG